jgi:hypothetical protein
MKRKPIYVETLIDADIAKVWEYTQVPQLHKEWDLRFSDISYLPKDADDAPQHFLYETKIGFGIKVSGKGESVGTHSKQTGESTSALKFWSDEKISLISTGSGYWKYIPQADGLRFLTWYDYKTRYGYVGSIIDKFAFRPLIGWATAWSFDALKIWIEKGIHPRISKNQYFIYAVANVMIALIWLYHGIIPKLLYMETGEQDMMSAAGFFSGFEKQAVYTVGIAEMLFGLSFLFFGRLRVLHYLNIGGLLVLAMLAFLARPEVYTEPFNPATTSLGAIGLSIVALKTLNNLPDAGQCLRKPKKKNDVDL